MSNIRNELSAALDKEHFDVTKEGIYFPRQGVLAQGTYFDRVNGGEWVENKNLVVDEGLAHILNVAMGKTVKPANYYIALFSGSATPAANWTAATFATVASEVTSLTEGYTAATRPEWVSASATGNSIDNMGAAAKLTIATSSQINVTGAALLTSNQRGGTTGALISASKYSAARVFQNGDIFEVGYRISLTV